MFSKAPGTSPRPSLTTNSSDSSFERFPQFDPLPSQSVNGHPFFSPSSFQQVNLTEGITSTAQPDSSRSNLGIAPGKPYPSLERRQYRDVSSSGDVSTTLDASGAVGSGGGFIGSGASTPIGTGIARQPSPTPPVGTARSVSGASAGIGAIGDGRKVTPSPSPSPEKKHTLDTGSSLGAGGLSSSMDDYPSSNSNSRPSSFILDVLPSRSPRLSTSPGSMDAFPSTTPSAGSENVLAGLAHSSLFHSPSNPPSNNLSVSRSSSPGANPDQYGKRLDALEIGLRELSGVVNGELRSMKEQLAMLKNLVMGGSVDPVDFNNHSRDTSAQGQGGKIGNGLFGLESPMLTVRSPSPHQSPQALPPPQSLRTSTSQSSLSYLNLRNSPTPSSSFLDDASNASLKEKDDQIRSLTQQMSALTHTVSQLMNGGGIPGVASPINSPLLSGVNNNNPLRQHSLPPLGGLGLSTPQLNGSPNIGLGVSTPRSPLIRPSSANSMNSLNRQSSIGSRFANNTGDDERKRSGLSYGQSNYDQSNAGGSNWGESSNGMTSPMIGGPPGGQGQGGSNNAPGSLGSKWEALGVGTDLFRAIAKFGLGPPTKIQAKAIPCVLRSQDIVSQAPSIQERIQSYVVPAIQMLHSLNSIDPNASNKGIQVVILTATVDQAAQAQRLAVGLGSNLGIRTSLCAGSSSNTADLQNDANNLRKSSPHLLVGTPQKMLELFNLRVLNLNDVRLLIIDECDQLIARKLSDFVSNLVRLLPPSGVGPPPASPSLPRSPLMCGGGGGGSNTPSLRGLPGAFDTPDFASSPRFPSNSSMQQQFQAEEGRQTVIFSCTVPQDVLNFASSLQLKEPVRVLVRREGGDNSSPSIRGLRQYYLYIAMGATNGKGPQNGPVGGRRDVNNSREWKLEALADLCEDYAFESCVIWASSVESVEAVTYKLSSRSMEALALHQDMGQSARHQIMAKFRAPASRNGSKRALVVYDALCRSLTDVHQVSLVINYDLPRSVEDYVHRISCATASGYGNKAGTAINIVTPGPDVEMLRNIESFHRCKIAELPASFAGL